ncbi:hypothetical protein [Streptomyces sp. NPDC004266]|uniref:hypothetical protein n=1 Tax=Streptomyces sp. NPDC004266 TaxID=3364693 RepID=UPI0036745089
MASEAEGGKSQSGEQRDNGSEDKDGTGNQERSGEIARRLIVTTQVAAGILALITALVMLNSSVPITLIIATFTLSPVIFLYLGANLLWGFLAEFGTQNVHGSGGQSSQASIMAEAAKLTVTVQGVALGLVFAFAKNRDVDLTVQVGAVALVAGVILGLLLYTLVVVDLPTVPCQVVASILYNMTLWSASYGLTCIAFSLFT